jgi:ATP-dependent Clp protease ATP-binding subunit ClpA
MAAVSPESLFVGLMRQDGLAVYPVVAAGADLLKLRQALGGRFEVAGDPPADMTADDECKAILMAARKEAELRKHSHLTPVHMFFALMQQPPQQVVDWIRAAGGDPAKVIAETETIFAGMS